MVRDICSRLLPLLEAACPSVSRGVQVKSLPCGGGLLRVSMQSVSSVNAHVGDRQVRFAGGGCPPSKTSSIVTFAKKVSDRDSEPGKKASFSSAWAASKGMFVELTAYSRSSGYDRYVDGWILQLFLPDWSSKCRQTDPRKSAKINVRFKKRLTCSKESFS